MNDRTNKFAAVIAVLFEINLIISVSASAVSKQWHSLFLNLLAMFCILLPFVIAWVSDKKNIVLPPGFKLIFLLFILSAEYLGEIKKFYVIFWWWDLFLHGVSGSCLVFTALYFMRGIIIKDEKSTVKRYAFLISLLAFSFSITLGTLWEIFEFMADYFFKTSMIKGGLEDTLTDLIIKVLAAFITSAICCCGLIAKNKNIKAAK